MPEFIRQLDLSNRECEQLIKSIDARDDDRQTKSARRHPRHTYPLADVPICIEHPDGGKSYVLVYSRNLSNGGMSFLHGGFIHTNSRCTIILRSIEGDLIGLSAKVRHCRLIQGSCHEIGIKFSQEIDISQFLIVSDSPNLASGVKT